jgi:hypothetical protein
MNTTETMTTWADNATDRTIVGIEDRHTLLLLCKCGRMRVSGIGPFLPTLAYNYEIDVVFFLCPLPVILIFFILSSAFYLDLKKWCIENKNSYRFYRIQLEFFLLVFFFFFLNSG